MRDRLADCRAAIPLHPRQAIASFHQARMLVESDAPADELRRSVDACVQRWYDLRDSRVSELASLVVDLMEMRHAVGQRAIVVMAPMFTPENLSDGFFRRVHAIDRLFPREALRVYIGGENAAGKVSLKFFDEAHVALFGSISNENFAKLLAPVAGHADLVYCQSAYHLIPPIVESATCSLMLDFHGVAPEEVEMMGEERMVPVLSGRERYGVEHADVIITVTDAMRAHIVGKYPSCYARFITIPIFDEPVLQVCDEPLNRSDVSTVSKPVVVYAGGMQAWQMIPRMCDAIEKAGDTCTYRIFTPDIPAFWNEWDGRQLPSALEVSTASPSQVVEGYSSCDFGFVLRDDSVVNKVACPTKLVEYCACGVIPILLSDDIGDFRELGMQGVSVDDLEAGLLPGAHQRFQMVENNKLLAQGMAHAYREGISRLVELFDGCFSGR